MDAAICQCLEIAISTNGVYTTAYSEAKIVGIEQHGNPLDAKPSDIGHINPFLICDKRIEICFSLISGFWTWNVFVFIHHMITQTQ